jgi:muramoyltetrapeptide carboxypeptidase
MITYPLLNKNAKIGVMSPSSGVPAELHHLLDQSSNRIKKKGYSVSFGETAWTQEKAKAASADVRASEFMKMMSDVAIGIVIPPWGGELILEILELLDFENIKNKWVLGYSDTSALLFAITVKTGIATAHGTNFIDLRGEYWDETTAMWEKTLFTPKGGSIIQTSSEKFQKEWSHDQPSPFVFHLTEPTRWNTVSRKNERLEGRLLGGCIDIIQHLAGTEFGDITAFQEKHLGNEPILWYFENCDLTSTGLRRALIGLKLSGWFNHCSGVMFGRSAANTPVNGYHVEEVYNELSMELKVPVVFDIDCGHQPPQMTFINGAYAEVEIAEGKGILKQFFN